MPSWFVWIAVVLILIDGVIGPITKANKPREPITGGEAAFTAVIYGLVIAGLLAWGL